MLLKRMQSWSAAAVIFCSSMGAESASGQAVEPICQTGRVLVVCRSGPDAVVTNFVSQKDQPVPTRTQATVGWRDTHLEVRFACADTNIVFQERVRNDPEMWRDDGVEVFLDIGHSHSATGARFHLLVTAGGGMMDDASGIPGYQGTNVHAQVERIEGGWSARLEVPWSLLGARPKPGDVWGFNLNRGEHPAGEYQCWSPTWGMFNRYDHWGHLVFCDASNAPGREVIMTAQEQMDAVHSAIRSRYITDPAVIARIAAEEGLGCEGNPTGDPIGGGPGYRQIFDSGDFVVRTAAELLEALARAKPGQVIFVPGGTEIDMAGRADVALPAGVTLAGTRGRTNAPPSRIVMRRRQSGSYYLFQTAGSRVRLTGLVLEGPDDDPAGRNGYSNLMRTRHFGLELDNCEVLNWGYSAIAGQPGAGGLHIHHCDIHSANGAAHDGYGVSLDGCDGRIVANRFAAIRNHAIAGTGAPGTAYEAAYNLVDNNFDMHGGADRGDGTDIGGDWMDIHHNTFLKVNALPCIARGRPSQGGQVHHNRFAASVAESVGRSVEALAERNIRAYRNLNGAKHILEE